MTVVGKILVFIVLLFSLGIGALLALDYAKRTEWADAYGKLRKSYDMADASEKAYKKEAEATKEAAELLVRQYERVTQSKIIVGQMTKEDAARAGKDLEDRLKKARASVVAMEETIKGLSDQVDKLKQKTNTSDAVVTAGQTEIAKRQTDAEELRKALGVQTKANIDLAAQMNKVREDKVAAEIQLRSMTDRATRLQDQVQEAYREVARVRASGGGAGSARVAGAKNPPPENVEGLIKNTDPGSGLVTITIGSDAGLAKGQTLEVFRLSNVPHQSKYLGTIRLLDVTATQAVGQPTGRMTAPPQAGDRVASYILGS